MNRFHPVTRSRSLLLALALLIGRPGLMAAEIPDRPEKLQFPPLAYEPPAPAE